MKEIIVIPREKIKVLTSGSRFPVNGYFTFNKDDVKVEQVPTNWEELKELCKDKKGVVITDNGNGIYFRHLFFWKEGIIEDKKQNLLSEATPERQYRIIKSLIGEE